MNDNPLIQAMQMKKNNSIDMNDPGQLLDFILSRFNLVPKDDNEGSEEGQQEEADVPSVQTQESHTP